MNHCRIQSSVGFQVFTSSGKVSSYALALGAEDTPVEDLYRRFAPYVGAVASRILGRPHEVEDVVQDVFVAALRGLTQTGDIQRTKRWLVRVTVRSARRQLRKRSLWKLSDWAESPPYESIAAPSAGPEEQRQVAEVCRVLDELPTKEQTAWILRYVEGESLNDTAALCDCSLATAKRRVAAVQRVLAERLRAAL